MAYGQLTNVGIAFQNSFGTPANVNSAHYIPHLSESLKKAIPPMYSEAIRGIFDEGDSYEGPHTVEGDLETEVDALSLGALLKCVLNLESSVQSGGIYTHTFRPRTADFDDKSAGSPVTVFVDRDVGATLPYSDLNGSTLELSVANGEFLKTKVGFVGGDVGSGAPLNATYPTGKKFTWDVTSVSIAGAGQDAFAALTITVDEGLEAMHTLDGGKTPNRIKRQSMRSIAIDGTLKFDNLDEYNEFISQSERELVLTFTGPVEIQSGYTEKIELTLPALRYEAADANAGGPGQLELAATMRGKYHVGSATGLQVVLVNTQATY